MVRPIWVRRYSLDHPVAELGQQLEVRLLRIRDDDALLLFRNVFEGLEKLGLSIEHRNNVIGDAVQLHVATLPVELVKFVFDFFAPVEILGCDLAILVHVVQLHELEDAVRPIQVDQVLVFVVGHQVTIHCEEAHSVAKF